MSDNSNKKISSKEKFLLKPNTNMSQKSYESPKSNIEKEKPKKIKKQKKPKNIIEDSESEKEEESESISLTLSQNQKKNGIHFQIISNLTISIEFVPEQCITEEIEQIIISNGAYFEDEMKLWLAPFQNYETIKESLNKFSSDYNIIKIPGFTLNLIKKTNYTQLEISEDDESKEIIDYSSDDKNNKHIEMLPKHLLNSLYPFQKEGINFGIKHHCRFLLADEMGVGKTIQAISLTYLYKENWPVLICCPGSMKYSWKAELIKWLLLKEKYIQIINSSKSKLNEHCKFYISSYDLLRHIKGKLKAKNFNFVILDEAHCIKNKDAKRTKSIIPIAIRAKRLILLTGTPLLNKPMEGYTSLYVLRPDLFYNFGKYGKRYCDPIPTPFGINWSGASYTKELHFILSTMMIRRLKKDVLSELPPKRRSKIEIEVDKKILEQIKNNEKVNNGINNESVMDLYSLSGLAKIKGVIEYINDLLESDEKFLLFAHHQIVLNSIEDFLKRKKKKYIRIDGKTPQEMRFEYVKKYQEDINYKVALLSINAASTGLTLTSANIVVFAELIWTPALMIQAEDRAHRIGQNSGFVDIKYLYGPGTIDDYIFSKLQKKLLVVSTTLDDKQIGFGIKNSNYNEDNNEKNNFNKKKGNNQEVNNDKKLYGDNINKKENYNNKILDEGSTFNDEDTQVDSKELKFQKKDFLDSLKSEYSFDLNIHPEFMKEKRVKINNFSNEKEEDIIFPKLNINQ